MRESPQPCSSAHFSQLVADAILDDYTRVGEPDVWKEGVTFELQEGKSAKDIRFLKVALPDIPAKDKRLCFGKNRFPVVVQSIQPSTGKLVGHVFAYGLGQRVTQFEYRPADNKQVKATQDTHATAVAEASASKVEGDYDSPGDGLVSLKTILLNEEKKVFAAKVVTASPRGCTGEFSGTGTLQGSVLTLAPTEKDGSAGQCSITLTFDKTGSKAKVQEDKCSDYHGMNCSFDGEVSKKR